MPDFDTRDPPQEPNEPNRVRIQLVAINRVHNLLRANRFRSLLVGGVLLFAMAVVPLGLLIYSSSGAGDLQQEAAGGGGKQEAINEEPNGKKIALGVSRRGDSFQYDRDYDLYVMNVEGSSLVRLADGVDPAWSPDGKVAFVRYVEEPNASASAAPSTVSPAPFFEVPYVYVMNADGSDQKKLLDKPAVGPAWSPDGKEIAFSLYYEDSIRYKGQGYSTCGIYVMNADGSGEPRKLKTGPGCASPPSWSPDDNKIAYTCGQGWDGYSKANIYVVKVSDESNTNDPRPLTNFFPESAGGPSWSPDGTEIAFTHADRAGKATIYKMNADGSGETPHTHYNEDCRARKVGLGGITTSWALRRVPRMYAAIQQ